MKKDLQKENVNETKATTGSQPRKSRALLQDKAGNLWFGNGKNGVTVYNGKTFTHYSEKDGLSSNFVFTVLEDNSGKLWFGTADGITCYAGKKFTIIPITEIKKKDFIYTKTEPNRYGSPQPAKNFVMSILQDGSGTFWLGTSDGVYCYDGKSFTHFAGNYSVVNNTGVNIGSIESILQDAGGNIWFGGRGTTGVFRYDGNTLTNFKPAGDDWVCPLMQDRSGNIWFGKRAPGVLWYDGKNFNPLGENEFSGFFFSMEEDNNGNFWFGNGRNSGVTFYDGKNFTNYTVLDGLCDAHMRHVTKDKEGNMWFNCKETGLCRYDGKAFNCFSE